MAKQHAHTIAKDARALWRTSRAANHPALGAIKLQKLRPEHIEQWHATLLGGLAPHTVRHAHSVLKIVLGRAVENNTLTRNAATMRRPPAVEASEIEILTPDQITTVLAALEGHTLYPIAALALATGMRRGELLGLQWGDVDLDSATLRVTKDETRLCSAHDPEARVAIGLQFMVCACQHRAKVLVFQRRSVAQLG